MRTSLARPLPADSVVRRAVVLHPVPAPAAIVLPDDADLIRRAKAGDGRAFGELARLYGPRIFRLVCQLTRSPADAHEITQDAFLLAFQKLPSFRGDSSFMTWMRRIAVNLVLMRRRHDQLCPQEPLDELTPLESERGSTHPDWSQPEQVALNRELREAIEQAVAALPESYRTVFVLRDVEGLSCAEIAETVRDTESSVKSRLHRARLRLRATIEAFYQDRDVEARWLNPPTKSS